MLSATQAGFVGNISAMLGLLSVVEGIGVCACRVFQPVDQGEAEVVYGSLVIAVLGCSLKKNLIGAAYLLVKSDVKGFTFDDPIGEVEGD